MCKAFLRKVGKHLFLNDLRSLNTNILFAMLNFEF